MDPGGTPCRPRSAPRRHRSPTGIPPGPRRPRWQEGPERPTAPSGSPPQPCHPIPSSSHRALDVLSAFLLNQIPQANRLPIPRKRNSKPPKWTEAWNPSGILCACDPDTAGDRTPKLSSNTVQGSTDAAQTLLATGMKSSREVLELQNAPQDPQIIRATGHP